MPGARSDALPTILLRVVFLLRDEDPDQRPTPSAPRRARARAIFLGPSFTACPPPAKFRETLQGTPSLRLARTDGVFPGGGRRRAPGSGFRCGRAGPRAGPRAAPRAFAEFGA